ncbi:hypothetical protein CORC01_12646 [Colletotrichum orchidophilum]|uniref:Uncharacterized protein n=1 Tax=Colletotrichum orchidophilum TaxID=1209926 RepID=A0A1G4ASH5_9PEZI|nr:uncharacterized protein CORC01_12646 [Colletotrichum orchidophilum]OHE92065.1 hypothetical protein CORC01_12646 [Colletotrichum orchidophilum]
MKFTTILATIATAALSVKAADRVQCAGTISTGTDKGRYEPSGALTANLTEAACKDGDIDAALKGNQKCCISNEKNKFGTDCLAAAFPQPFNHTDFKPTFQPC